VVLGAGCPDRLRPARTDGGDGEWDLVVLAPSAAEGRSDGWIEESVRRVGVGLAADGLAYVLADPGARRRIARALRAAGVPIAGGFVHLPDCARSELVVPLRRRTIRASAGRMQRSWARLAATAASAAPGLPSALAHLHGGVGVVARRPGAAPLGAWLTGAAGENGIASIRTRWRADRTRTVVHLISGDGAFVKLAWGPGGSDATRREATALAGLGAEARASGAAVPEPVLFEPEDACPALRLSALPGVPARAVLARRPARRERILRALGVWLEAWSRATRRPVSLDPERLHAWILGPARRLADAIPGGCDYAQWLEARCRGLEGRSVPLVAAHNDLTMANVLVAEGDRIGILDWESATPDGMPLGDFAYAAVDATAAANRYRDRAAAFQACFEGPGSEPVAELMGRLSRAIDLPADWATLAFHACWLQHAEDERRKRSPGEALPFLECVRHAARLRWQA
jgi:hypothetical protein